jgi:hypothetical protein
MSESNYKERRIMKTTVWQKKKVVIYIGGNPASGQVPEITIELDNPQIQFDSDNNSMIITETK